MIKHSTWKKNNFTEYWIKSCYPGNVLLLLLLLLFGNIVIPEPAGFQRRVVVYQYKGRCGGITTELFTGNWKWKQKYNGNTNNNSSRGLLLFPSVWTSGDRVVLSPFFYMNNIAKNYAFFMRYWNTYRVKCHIQPTSGVQQCSDLLGEMYFVQRITNVPKKISIRVARGKSLYNPSGLSYTTLFTG